MKEATAMELDALKAEIQSWLKTTSGRKFSDSRAMVFTAILEFEANKKSLTIYRNDALTSIATGWFSHHVPQMWD
jgi:hypothetical protein